MARSRLLLGILVTWFLIQVLLNVVTVVYLAASPPPEPVLPSEWVDSGINTAVLALITAGLLLRRPWSWRLAVVFLPLYWVWNLPLLVSPRADLELGLFLLADASVLGILHTTAIRSALDIPQDRWRYLPSVALFMSLLALFILLRVPLGGDTAAAMAVIAAVWLFLKKRKRGERPGPVGNGSRGAG